MNHIIPPPKFPPLYPLQYNAIYDPKPYSVIHASTKSGKTVGCHPWLTELGISGGKAKNYFWMAPINKQAMRFGYDGLSIAYRQWDPKNKFWRANKTEQSIEILINGAVHCKFWFFGSEDPDSVYGAEYWGGVVDEASRCKEDSWTAIESTVTATNGPIRLIGNMKGRSNWTYQLGQLGKDGDPDIAYHKITAYDAIEAGVLDPKIVERRKKTMSPPQFKELYLAEPADSADQYFRQSVIESHRKSCTAPTRWTYSRELNRLIQDASGCWYLWNNDGVFNQDTNYVCGIDISYGNGMSDSVIAVMDRETGEFVAEYVDPNIVPHDLARVVSEVGKNIFGGQRGEMFVNWEVNGPGNGFHRHILRRGYNHLYYQRREGSKGERKGRKYGWTSSRDRKKDRLSQFHSAMSRQVVPGKALKDECAPVIIHSEKLLTEMERYIIYEDDSIGPDSLADQTSGARANHGDRVIAYMLAVMARREAARFEKAKPKYASDTYGHIAHHAELEGDVLENTYRDPFTRFKDAG